MIEVYDNVLLSLLVLLIAIFALVVSVYEDISEVPDRVAIVFDTLSLLLFSGGVVRLLIVIWS